MSTIHIEVISSVNEARADRFINRTTIVIDVLRATSTIVTALEAGASGIVPVETVLDAKELRRQGDLLAGERSGRKIPGFELGNSPEDFCADTVKGRRILLTTTNGTRALHKAMRADYLLAGSLLNVTSCAKAAADLRRDVVILCSGSHDEFALEDGLCAGIIVDRLQALCPCAVETNDIGLAMLGLYRSSSERIPELLCVSNSGKRLIKSGYSRDIEYCAQIDVSFVVPRLDGDMLIGG